MEDRPTTPPPAPSPLGVLDALNQYVQQGWSVQAGQAWLATRTRGSQTRVIAGNTAAELLARLDAAAAKEAAEGNTS